MGGNYLKFHYILTHLYRMNSDSAAAAASLWYFWGRYNEFFKNRQIFCTYIPNKERKFVNEVHTSQRIHFYEIALKESKWSPTVHLFYRIISRNWKAGQIHYVFLKVKKKIRFIHSCSLFHSSNISQFIIVYKKSREVTGWS